MRRVAFVSVMLALMAALTACGDYANSVKSDISVPASNGPNPGNLPNPNTVPKPLTPQGYASSLSPVTIEEVMLDPVGPNSGLQYVELYNASSSPADLGGWVLSSGADNYTFPYGFTVAAGDRVLVHLFAAGTETANQRYAPSFGELDAVQGSLALLRGGVDVVDYVQWGNPGHAFESAAASVSEWVAGDYVLAPIEGHSLNYTGLANDSSAWFEWYASPGN
ncbi:MAG: lamin tail domain-containing protein [Planctomycetes bacterium]|nr:lamin tail domain-containing protein [Planctomycetota bacterium]